MSVTRLCFSMVADCDTGLRATTKGPCTTPTLLQCHLCEILVKGEGILEGWSDETEEGGGGGGGWGSGDMAPAQR